MGKNKRKSGKNLSKQNSAVINPQHRLTKPLPTTGRAIIQHPSLRKNDRGINLLDMVIGAVVAGIVLMILSPLIMVVVARIYNSDFTLTQEEVVAAAVVAVSTINASTVQPEIEPSLVPTEAVVPEAPTPKMTPLIMPTALATSSDQTKEGLTEATNTPNAFLSDYLPEWEATPIAILIEAIQEATLSALSFDPFTIFGDEIGIK